VADPEEKIRVSVAIPAYNEELGVEGVVLGIRSALSAAGLREKDDFEIVVIDDGSTDDTAAAARRAGARVVSHPVNRGYGRALATGFAEARFPWILMIDADGSYPPEDAAKLLPFAPRFDMAIGARQGSFFWGSPLKAFLRWVYLRIASFVAGERIPDANSGLRLFRKDSFDRSMPMLCYGYSMSTTMTLSFLNGGRFVAFVPVDYRVRKGKSKVRAVRDILRTLQIMLQVILYFNPLKFAVCLAAVPAGLGLLSLFVCGAAHHGPFAGGVVTALAVFLWGCVLESIRLHRPGRT